jgi:hypothetical protein
MQTVKCDEWQDENVCILTYTTLQYVVCHLTFTVSSFLPPLLAPSPYELPYSTYSTPSDENFPEKFK